MALLRLEDADEMEDTLRAYQRMEKRGDKASVNANKFRTRSAAPSTPALSKPARAVRTIHVEKDNNSSESDLSGSDSETDLRQVCMATRSDHLKNPCDTHIDPQFKNKIIVQDPELFTHGMHQRADHKA